MMTSPVSPVTSLAGYLANPRLAKVHWQAGDRPVPEQSATVAGESVLWVDPADDRPGSSSRSSLNAKYSIPRSLPGARTYSRSTSLSAPADP